MPREIKCVRRLGSLEVRYLNQNSETEVRIAPLEGIPWFWFRWMAI